MGDFPAGICRLHSSDALGASENGRSDVNVAIVQRRVSARRTTVASPKTEVDIFVGF